MGGFGKKAGEVPDVYHSALGLMALSLMGEEGLRGLDARTCLSGESVRWVEGLAWRRKLESQGTQEVDEVAT